MMVDEKPKGRDTIFKVAGVLLGLAIILGYSYFFGPKTTRKPTVKLESGVVAILDAVAAKKSGSIVQGFAAVKSILPDDAEGGKHQNFAAALENGHTLQFRHNIDIAPRVPVKLADLIEFRGQLEWNEQGGTVHWTHHDPDMKHEDGWIKLNDKVYR